MQWVVRVGSHQQRCSQQRSSIGRRLPRAGNRGEGDEEVKILDWPNVVEGRQGSSLGIHHLLEPGLRLAREETVRENQRHENSTAQRLPETLHQLWCCEGKKNRA